jgi:electron-transferring-flavoprotein dehydrogenase
MEHNKMEREQMIFDLLIIGAGPAGLSAAIRAKQLRPELTVCVLEKGSEVGAHILSGAIFDPIALKELFTDDTWKSAPLGVPVTSEELLLLRESDARKVPHWSIPKPLHNQGYYILSLGKLCRWLAEQAQSLGVEIFPGFAAQQVKCDFQGVIGVITGDMGRDKHGELKPGGMLGIEILAKQTLFAEGCRGHLGKELINRFYLAHDKDPQHYAIGFKEIWRIDAGKHQQGKVIHTFGWPLKDESGNKVGGGGFIYHAENQQLSIGLIVDLNYQNPHLDPYEEFQQFKRHPLVAELLNGAERISYGARTLAKGGWHSLPRMSFAGGMLIGCDAGTLDGARLKGCHTAMKSGMLAAELVAKAGDDCCGSELALDEAVANSWLGRSLYAHRNAVVNLHSDNQILGGALNWFEQNLLKGHPIWGRHDHQPDHSTLLKAKEAPVISYPKPDRQTTFNRTESLVLANLSHDHDQPNHLQLTDPKLPIRTNLPTYNEPAQRYCPAGVYEIEQIDGKPKFVINSQNCLHCKCCDIKDPAQNINWITPEGGAGPNYIDM